MKKKKRKPLDLNVKPKDLGGARKGDVRNPTGKIAGTLTRSTNLGNEAKINLFQAFQRSHGPQVLITVLNLKLPEQFVPKHMRDRHRDGELTVEDEAMIARKIETNYWRGMDFMAKLFPKTLGVHGTIQTEETVAGRTKRASREAKSPGVVEMVRRKTEEEMYEVEDE